MEEKRILIVDDDPDICEAMKVILENEGYKVEYALDGNEGMNHLKSHKPDVLILDVMMRTRREGFVMSRELKKNPEYKNIPILMVTGVKEFTGIDFKDVAGDKAWLPVDEYLDKPVKPEVLVEKVKQLLQKQ